MIGIDDSLEFFVVDIVKKFVGENDLVLEYVLVEGVVLVIDWLCDVYDLLFLLVDDFDYLGYLCWCMYGLLSCFGIELFDVLCMVCEEVGIDIICEWCVEMLFVEG